MATPSNPAMAAALARLWTRFLPEIENRVGLLETAAAALSVGTLTAEQREAAHDAAHKLAGTAGMFGFERLSRLGLRFEQAAESDPANAQELSAAICTAIEATRAEIHARPLPKIAGGSRGKD